MGLEKTGCSEFCSQIRQESRTYSIFAVKLPVEELVKEVQHRFRVESWEDNIKSDRFAKLSDIPGVAVIKFKNNPWVTVYWSTGRYLHIAGECCLISAKFKTQVINLWEKDNSGWIEWFVYQNGEERESVEREVYQPDEDGKAYFESSLRKSNIDFEELDETSTRDKLDESINELLSEQNVYIPGLDLDLSHPDIERVDMLVLPSRPLGMLDFQKCVYEGHPEYTIFAVKAPIDKVNEVLTKYQADAEFKTDVRSDGEIRYIMSENDQYWMPIIQIQNNDWTVVYWNPGNYENLSKKCREISSTMQTKVMELSEEDTSGAVGYTLYTDGKQIEFMEWCPGEEISFESEIREEPELDNFEDAEDDVVNGFINDTFIEEGIYIPAWTMRMSDPWLGRVDLMRRF